MEDYIRGKSIKIYLHRGEKDGVKHVEIPNWSGQALYSPRKLINKLSNEEIILRPCVYFLFGEDIESGQESVYIGEAENGFDRIKTHVTGKDFWSEVILFSNKDNNLTKGHIKYLESRLIDIAKSAERYNMVNSVGTSIPTLPNSDVDFMEDFIDDIKIVLEALRYKVLIHILPIKIEKKSEPVTKKQNIDDIEVFIFNKSGRFLSGLRATKNVIFSSGLYTNDGIVVRMGSFSNKRTVPSFESFKSYKKERDSMIATGILIDDGEFYKFSRDYLFKSLSAAATVILGSPANGRWDWRNKDGKSINDLEKMDDEKEKENNKKEA